jgi:hypothetical protein
VRRTPTPRGRYGQDDLMTCHDREHFDGKLAAGGHASGYAEVATFLRRGLGEQKAYLSCDLRTSLGWAPMGLIVSNN